MTQCRKVAANRLVVGGRIIRQVVVELAGDKVLRYYPLNGETACTEWLGGTLRIMIDEGLPHLYKGGQMVTSNNN